MGAQKGHEGWGGLEKSLAVGGTCVGADQRCPGTFGLGRQQTALALAQPRAGQLGLVQTRPCRPTQGIDRCRSPPGDQVPVGRDPGTLLPRGWHPTDSKQGPPQPHVSPGVCSCRDSIDQG